MMQFKAYGYTLDLPEGTSVQLTRKNEIFAFDDIECERSVGFDLPATPTNEKVMQLAGNYHGDGVQMRVRIDAQMIVGVVTYNGYLYVQQYDLTKQSYKAVFVFGQLSGLRALKEAGKFGELGLQTDLYITDDSIIYSAPDALTRAWARVQYATYNPHGSVSVKLLFDMLAAQTDLPPVILPADAEGLRVIKGKNNGFDYDMQMASDVNPDAGYQPDTTLPENPYNLCTYNADLFETCEEAFGLQQSMAGQVVQLEWNIQGIKAKAPLRLTFPQEIGGAWFARKNGWQSGAIAFWGDYWYEPVLNGSPRIHGESLAGKTIELQQGDELYLVNVGDFVYTQISGDITNGWMFANTEHKTFPYDFTVKIEGESRYYLRDNMPDMTPLELCKIVAAVTGKVLRYSDTAGVYFDDLATWTMMDLQDVTKRKTMDRTFNGYARHNLIRFDDEDNEEAQEIDYTIDNATIDEVKELQEIKMSQGKQGVYLSQPAIALVGENDTIARTVTDAEFGGKNYLQRVELTKIAAIQDFCDTSTSLQLEAMMNILQYKQITPTTLLRYDGAQWAWSELQWNRERVQMKLAMRGAIGEVAFNWLSAEARAIIIGAFGSVDGAKVITATNEYLDNIAIVDINKATALAGFINEDPMMVCSLPLEMQNKPYRAIVSDGTGYFDTGITATPGIKWELDIVFKNSGKSKDMQSGAGAANNSNRFIVAFRVNNTWNAALGSNYFSTSIQSEYNKRMRFVLDTPNNKIWFNDEQVSATSTLVTSSTHICIFTRSDGSDYNNYKHAGNFFESVISMNGTEAQWLVPFKDNGVMEMIDLTASIAAGQKVFITKSGTFTETFTKADGVTPWTPLIITP